MEEWFPNTYNKHQEKIWKKNKGKRLVRKIAKATAKRHGGAAGMVMMSGKDDEEEELEKERLKEECEERAIKNKLWREKRERERLGIPEKKKVDKNLRNEKFGSEMKCKKCREDLTTEIWQCKNGHPVCENCFDKDTFQEIINQRLIEKFSTKKSSISSQRDLPSRTSILDMKSETTLSEKLNCLEIGSYIRPKVDSIDFFSNTLNIRKDAIQAYSDYNAYLIENDEDSESLSFGSRADKLDNEDNETVFYNRFLKEECPPPYVASVNGGYLNPVTLDEMIKEDEKKDKAAIESNWKLSMEKKKKELDFFANTLEIRKNAIETYKDYSKLLEENAEESNKDDLSDDTEVDESDDDTEYDDDTSTATSEDGQIVNCPVCKEPIVERNLHAEKISKLFFSMMEFRNKME